MAGSAWSSAGRHRCSRKCGISLSGERKAKHFGNGWKQRHPSTVRAARDQRDCTHADREASLPDYQERERGSTDRSDLERCEWHSKPRYVIPCHAHTASSRRDLEEDGREGWRSFKFHLKGHSQVKH